MTDEQVIRLDEVKLATKTKVQAKLIDLYNQISAILDDYDNGIITVDQASDKYIAIKVEMNGLESI